MIGQTIAHYRIESKLGEGGMGVVYKATDTHLDRLIAIKVLARDRITDPARKQRFVQEAKAASALNHPNIVTIHDIGTAAGVDFMVMEFIEGQTLDTLIPRDGMRSARALKHAVQMADALAKAHGAGIVHRDLKPSNVMVTDDGRVKILDFGVAKLLEPAESSTDAATRTVPAPLTEEGAVIGTAAYMSPEQVEGQKLDARSDIFSFGSVLYEMVTARRPFTGGSSISIVARVLSEEPTPPREFARLIPPELEGIILRCLRKDPARRFQTMADLKVALEDVKESPNSRRAGTLLRRRSVWTWAWAAVPLIILPAAHFAWQASRDVPTAQPLQAVSLTTFPGVEISPSLAPEGNHVAFTWNGINQDNFDIYVQQIGAGSPLRLTTDSRNDQNPAWSPDGRWIAFLRGEAPAGRALAGKTELRVIPPLGGPERKVAEIVLRAQPNQSYLAWCPDNTCLIVTHELAPGKPFALFVISFETGEKRQLTDPPDDVVGDTSPAVAPDGRSLVFQRFPSGAGAELYWLPLDEGLTGSGEPRRLTPVALNAQHPVWMPDGREILFSADGRLWRAAVSGDVPPARLAFVGEDGSWPVVSRPEPGRPSRLVYVRSFADWNIWRVETSGTGAPSSPAAVAIASTRADSYAELSPTGRQVAFVSDRGGAPEIWVAERDGSSAVQLTSLAADGTAAPRWSPDEQTIVFNTNLEGQQEIYAVPAAGGKPRRLTSDPANDIIPSYSHDGRWIYFCSHRSGERQIWKIPASGGEAIQVTHNVGWVALEAPGGADLYYTQTSGPEPSALWRLSTSGGQPVKVLDGVYMRAFVVLETGIYYVNQQAGESRLQFFDFATGRSSVTAGNLGNLRPGLTASRDGRTILYTRLESSVDDLMLVDNFQ